MEGNNEIIFCEAQMIKAVSYYLEKKLFNTNEFKCKVSGVDKGGNYNNKQSFNIKLSPCDKNEKSG